MGSKRAPKKPESPDEMYQKGMQYFESDFPKRKAHELLQKACALGHADACYELIVGGFSDASPREVEKNMIRAAEMGSVGAMTHLGVYYAVGFFGEKDLVQSFRWYYKAARRDRANAQYEMGFMRCLGEGCTKSVRAGEKWFLRAARGGHENAQKILLEAYRDKHLDRHGYLGLGIYPDKSKARKLATNLKKWKICTSAFE